jgi:hypothetical protein
MERDHGLVPKEEALAMGSKQRTPVRSRKWTAEEIQSPSVDDDPSPLGGEGGSPPTGLDANQSTIKRLVSVLSSDQMAQLGITELDNPEASRASARIFDQPTPTYGSGAGRIYKSTADLLKGVGTTVSRVARKSIAGAVGLVRPGQKADSSKASSKTSSKAEGKVVEAREDMDNINIAIDGKQDGKLERMFDAPKLSSIQELEMTEKKK